jgi:asparagine synthase (glutamine-hydrolysing)
MCGIAGFLETRPESPFEHRPAPRELLSDMCDVIRHRGPDDQGLWTSDGVALGMRRLSIIDLSTGQQPIFNEDSTVATVFNGEIYNFRELRSDLERRGHRFATATDTEVIVHAYEEWGTDAIRRLRGMFGLAIWDARTRTLMLARDRVGIKPLYYAQSPSRLYFGSELKSLLCAPDLPRDIDLDALDHYLSFLYTPRDGSIFRGIHKLLPGHLLVWRDGKTSISRFWNPRVEETFAGSEAEATEQLGSVLADAVRSHLVSDVPLGAFLSGGIDSSVVVGLMSRVSADRVKTFSIGFDEPGFDELTYARRVASHFGTEHHEFVVRPDGVAILDDVIHHFDEPFADASAIPTWYVSSIAREYVTVALSGDGGDELFGGYDRYLPHPRVARFDRYATATLRKLAATCAEHWPRAARGKNFLRHVARDHVGRYLDSIRYFSADDKAALLTADVREHLRGSDAEARLGAHFAPYAHLPWNSQMMHFDADTYLPEDVLVKVDRMSMAHSLECRVPLLDNEVLDFASTLPADFKIRNGRRKHVLKEVARALLPPDLIDRRKHGFSVPIGVWFRGSMRELFADTLLSQKSRARGYFDQSFVARLVDEHLSGTRDHTLRLWQLVIFERWHAQYVDRTSSPLVLDAPLVPAY